MKTVLITGGLGYVGGRLAKELVKSFSVVISTRGEVNDSIRTAFGDQVSFIRHESLLQADSFPRGISCVIHLAAMNELECIRFPDAAIEVNINQTRQILEHAVVNEVQKFIFLSTVHVYGQRLRGVVDEQTVPRPAHPYAITHRAAEDYVIEAHDSGRIQGFVIRLSNSFGMPVLPTVNRWTLLVNDICRQAVTQGNITLKSDGSQCRDFVTLTDVVHAIEFLIRTAPVTRESIYNLSSGESMTVLAMSQLVADISGQILKKKIIINLAENHITSSQDAFQIVPKNLFSSGFEFDNDIEDELRNMVLFCNHHFN